MRIGIEAQRLFRKKKHGMEVVTQELINHLQIIDKENEYIIFVKKGEDNRCIQESSNFKIKVVGSYSYPFWEQYKLLQAIKEENIDFLHCTSNTAPLLLKIPLLLTIHDIIYLESVDFGGSSYQNFGNLYRRFIVPEAAKRAKKVITVSEFERKNIISKLALPEDKIKTIYNAKSTNFRKIKEEHQLSSVKKKYKLPSDFLLFFGNMAPRKNTLGVLLAYEQYQENEENPLPLVISSLNITEIEAICAKNNIKVPNLEQNIKCIGYVDKEELPSLYNLATVYLYPSFREGFGLPIVEAMSCGVPVITSNVSSMPEVAGDAALLVNPNNPTEIVAAITKLTKDQALRQVMVQKGFLRAKTFDWAKTAEDTLSIYQQMI